MVCSDTTTVYKITYEWKIIMSGIQRLKKGSNMKDDRIKTYFVTCAAIALGLSTPYCDAFSKENKFIAVKQELHKNQVSIQQRRLGIESVLEQNW
jgi:hypothetical protein